MADINNQTGAAGAAPEHEASKELRPTLFIGVGGTGMEVLMRVRRRILNTLWGGPGARTRVESLAEFSVAQFIQFDLDAGAKIDQGRAQTEDLQYDSVKFTDDEKVVEVIDLSKYCRDDDTLEKYPHIKQWMPLTPGKIRDLRIEPGKGAGQIRAVSRLYLFDKYSKLRDKIRLKLGSLKAGLNNESQLKQLGIKVDSSKFRIVVVASVAGGTGSGAFLDMGYLARWLAKSAVAEADVELFLYLPSGYQGANKDRVEANGYAALMELESAMQGNRGYLGKWDAYEDYSGLDSEPYNEVYLVDSGNLAQQHTKDVTDIYHMVADALFEDFRVPDLARAKRSRAVNQAQFKNYPFSAKVNESRFKGMQLSYSQRYSSMGLAVLDTSQEARFDERAHRWAGEMLKAFFGVGGSDLGTNRATDKQRDDFMATHMALRAAPFNDFPEFSDKTIELKRSRGDFLDYFIVEDLLQDKTGLLLVGVEQRVNLRIDEIRAGFDRAEWPVQVREAVKQLERDAVRDQDSTADTTEDRVAKRRREVLERVKKTVRDQLYAYLDNKEFGGLEYVLSLVEQIKDRLEVSGNGLIAALTLNGERYREIKEAVRSRELERLLTNLEQTKGGFFGGGEKQAVTVMDQLRIEIANGIKFHLRAKAADEASLLLGELSDWLGSNMGVDAQGRAEWSGLVGELQAGRELVLAMLDQLQRANTILQQDLNKDHATLINIKSDEREVPMPGAAQLRTWADEAFKDFGGSKELFPTLGEAEQRSQILNKVKRMAERQIALSTEGEAESSDPLVEALSAMSVAAQGEVFSKLLTCAMPWIDANLAGDFSTSFKADQYKCYVGVDGAEKFKKDFGDVLSKVIPSQAGITESQLNYVETGIPGRAVCYVELSGVPLTVLRGLDSWRSSYRKEDDDANKATTHTHIDSTQFVHPQAPSTGELNRLAEDFRQYLLATMLGILTRYTIRSTPAGLYQFAVAPGQLNRIGNERAFRQDGLPRRYRDAIAERVQNQLNDASTTLLVATMLLCEHFKNEVYTPKMMCNAKGVDEPRQGFAFSIASEARNELCAQILRRGTAKSELDSVTKRLNFVFDKWAVPIGGSDTDAHAWEVQEPEKDAPPRLKYRIRTEMLEPGALEALMQTVSAAAIPASASMPVMFATPAMPGAMPPPLGGLPQQLVHQYHIGVNGQQYGPFGTQQLAQMLAAGQIAVLGTKVWRQGLPAWVELNQLAELALLLQSPPPLSSATPPPLA